LTLHLPTRGMAGLPAGCGIIGFLDIAAGDPVGEVDRSVGFSEKAETAMPVPPSAEPIGPLLPNGGISPKARPGRKPFTE
jgi:hypothetical protein